MVLWRGMAVWCSISVWLGIIVWRGMSMWCVTDARRVAVVFPMAVRNEE